MRKIINGKAYDTETAHLVGEWDNNSHSDSERLCEALYRKKTGEYFQYGIGGAHTHYAEWSDPSTYSGGDKITPLTPEKARKFAERYLTTEEYEAEFGITEE